ncbi:MAG: hypothetical protein KR126chlam2_01086 [Chlamydiae bacterium]|nr:hypothetical protein [Chlamydiota bacterium]
MFSDIRCYESRREATESGKWEMPTKAIGITAYKGRIYKNYGNCERSHGLTWRIGRFAVALIFSLPMITLVSANVRRLWTEAFTGKERRIIYVLQTDLPLATGPITLGLPNLSHTTCWLNATLKFIASTNYYDTMLTQPPPEGMEDLQRLLHSVVGAIRTDTIHQQLKKSTYNELVAQISQQVHGYESAGKQELDAIEFLINLCSCLNWAPLDKKNGKTLAEGGVYPQLARRFNPKADHVKYGSIESNIQTLVTVTLKLGENPIKLVKRIRAQETVETRPDAVGEKKVEEDDESVDNVSFTKTTFFTHLPDTLVLYLKRTAADEHGRPIKIIHPIQTDENGFLSFREYETELDGNGNIVGFTHKRRVYYRIAASISHSGSDSSGHYACSIGNKDKAFTHSDGSITSIDPKSLGVSSGLILRLEKVREVRLRTKK